MIALYQNSLILGTVTITALVATIIYYAVETRRQRKTNLEAASKLSSLSQEIVKAVRKTKKPAILEALAETLEKSTRQKVSPQQLEQRIAELENAGIIRSQIYNQI